MNIKKILIYVIFAFVMILPFSVSAEEKHDIKFNTSKIEMIDWDYLNRIKLNGYNAVISSSEYKSSHEVIETYNEFYLNHGYFIAYAPDGEITIYYDLDSDYITGYIFKFIEVYSDIDVSIPEIYNRLGILYYYDLAYHINDDGIAYQYAENQNYYSWIDAYINNTDLFFDYTVDDMLSDNVPDLYYPILGTNRSTQWASISTINQMNSSLHKSLNSAYGINFLRSQYVTNFGISDLYLKTFNNDLEANNMFRHPYSTEETEKVETNKTSTVISINSSNYTSLKLKYTISDFTTRKWNDYLFMWKYDQKATLDWLKVQINSTNSISYPRRYSNYKKGTEIETTKMPNDFGNTVLSTSYAASISSLGGANGVVSGYIDFDLRDLPENTIITIYLEYDSRYVQFEPIELPEVNFVEYDLTGKYAIGLVPKFTYSNNTFSLLYQGNFTSYYAFNANNYNVYDSENIKSIGDYSKKVISFSNFKDTTLYEKPIFYLINNFYTDNTQISKIKYNPNYFELLVFEKIDDVIISEYTGHSYESPSQNFNSINSRIESDVDSNSLIDFSELFTSLPDFIVGLGSAFTAICMCIVIVFDSLPAVVQSVLMFCLLVSAIALVIKLLK